MLEVYFGLCTMGRRTTQVFGMMTGVLLNPHSSIHASVEVGTCILKYAFTHCNFVEEYFNPSFAQKNVDITEDEEGVAVIQIHVRGVMQP